MDDIGGSGRERIQFTDVPTHLVSSLEPPRLDWWPFPPWPNPTDLAYRYGLGSTHGPGPDVTLQMLFDMRDDEDAVIAVLLRASIRQLIAYYPFYWRGAPYSLVTDLQRIVYESSAREPEYGWFGTTKMTLPLQLFRGARHFQPPASVTDLVALLALEHALLLSRWYPVRAVPLESVTISPRLRI